MKKAFYEDGKPYNGQDVINLVKQENDKILLSFSCGKDSIAAWLVLREHFEIVPYYLWLIPELEFIEDSLAYYEQFFGQHIIRLPHPSFYRMLNNFVYQTPERVSVIRAANFPNFNYDDIAQIVAGLNNMTDAFVATGIRAADSPNRRSAINRHGPINWNRRSFYPIWDMNLEQLVNVLTQAQVKLSVEYEYFGRSFDGIDYRFLAGIKKHFPSDYTKIIEWFPMAELELFRYERIAQ